MEKGRIFMRQHQGMWVLGILMAGLLLGSFAARAQDVPQLTMTRSIGGLDANGSLPAGTTRLTVTVTVDLAGGDPALVEEGSYYVEERWNSQWTLVSTGGACPPDSSSSTSLRFRFDYGKTPTFPCSFTYLAQLVTTPTTPFDVNGEVYYRVNGTPQYSATASDTIYSLFLTVEMKRSIAELGEDNALPASASTLAVTVDFDIPVGSPTALIDFGVQERWPDTWSFINATGACVPDILPAPGQQDTFNFIYSDLPVFPCSFTYRIAMPTSPSLPKDVAGETRYTLPGTGAQQGDTEVTSIQIETIEADSSRNIIGLAPDGSLPPGTNTLDVTLRLHVVAGNSTLITAFGAQERWPAGWVLAGGSGNCMPNATDNGEGTFNFVFDTVPTLPCSFTYTVGVPSTPILTGNHLRRDPVPDRRPLAREPDQVGRHHGRHDRNYL